MPALPLSMPALLLLSMLTLPLSKPQQRPLAFRTSRGVASDIDAMWPWKLEPPGTTIRISESAGKRKTQVYASTFERAATQQKRGEGKAQRERSI